MPLPRSPRSGLLQSEGLDAARTAFADAVKTFKMHPEGNSGFKLAGSGDNQSVSLTAENSMAGVKVQGNTLSLMGTINEQCSSADHNMSLIFNNSMYGPACLIMDLLDIPVVTNPKNGVNIMLIIQIVSSLVIAGVFTAIMVGSMAAGEGIMAGMGAIADGPGTGGSTRGKKKKKKGKKTTSHTPPKAKKPPNINSDSPTLDATGPETTSESSFTTSSSTTA